MQSLSHLLSIACLQIYMFFMCLSLISLIVAQVFVATFILIHFVSIVFFFALLNNQFIKFRQILHLSEPHDFFVIISFIEFNSTLSLIEIDLCFE